MVLVKATDDLKLLGLPRPGFPIVLNDDMSSCVIANRFLRHYLVRGQIGSDKSWEPIGQAVYDYFGFLEANTLCWDDVNLGEGKNIVAAYRDYCVKTVRLESSTTRQRVLYVCKFYEWAKRSKLVDTLPYEWEDRRALQRDDSYLQHTSTSGGEVATTSVMPKLRKKPKKYLTVEQSKDLLAAPMNHHHRMIIRLALGSGLRREELATFPAAYVVDPDRKPSSARNISIDLDPDDGNGMKTKGSKARTIWITKALMRDLHHYLVHRRGERASNSAQDHTELFLNLNGEPFAMDGKGLERQVRTVGQRVGIRVHPHMLRHTYATHMLSSMRRSGGRIDPLVFLQNQLGHESIATTKEYLHIVDKIADEAVLGYAGELDDLATSIQES